MQCAYQDMQSDRSKMQKKHCNMFYLATYSDITLDLHIHCAYQALHGGRGGCNMGGANALAGSLWPLPEWGLASTIIRESTVHLIAHQCLRAFFSVGISSFVTENLVQSRSIMWMIVSTHLPALPSPEKHESKATEWRRDQQCKQWLWISLWMPGGAWLVGAEGLVHICSHHTSSSYFYC